MIFGGRWQDELLLCLNNQIMDDVVIRCFDGSDTY